MSSQFHDEWSGALLHREPGGLGRRAQELRLRAVDVDHRVKADRLGHHAAPARVERAHDVALRLGRRRGRQEKRVLEAEAGERGGQIGGHGNSPFGKR